MSQLFNTNNPGIGDAGGVTLEEGLFLSNLESLSYQLGDILYYDGTQLQRLPRGANGQFLSLISNIPAWTSAGSGSGDMAAAIYDPANIAQQLVGITATQTLTNKTLTAPRFADLGFIADQNGNEMLAFNSNASAVNYIEIENGATGNPPHLRARGDDTNIGLHLVGKGTGEVSVCDATDETKRLRFGLSGNGTGIITTLRSNSTGTSKTIDLPNASGTVALTSDIPAAYTDEQAQDAVGAMAANSTFVSLTYNDGTPSLTPSLSATGTPSSTTFLRGDNTWAVPPSAGGGIVRSVSITSGNVTAGNTAATDYVIFVAGAHTVSLPSATSNTNLYTIKNNHSANITIDTVGSETIDGTASISIAPEESVQIISDGTNYFII